LPREVGSESLGNLVACHPQGVIIGACIGTEDGIDRVNIWYLEQERKTLLIGYILWYIECDNGKINYVVSYQLEIEFMGECDGYY
jgi:hypothetical protein